MSFNSYMVRFKVQTTLINGKIISVSIPIWFDLKRKPFIIRVKATDVSIPIWFDLKKSIIKVNRFTSLSFNSYMVRFKDAFVE